MFSVVLRRSGSSCWNSLGQDKEARNPAIVVCADCRRLALNLHTHTSTEACSLQCPSREGQFTPRHPDRSRINRWKEPEGKSGVVSESFLVYHIRQLNWSVCN